MQHLLLSFGQLLDRSFVQLDILQSVLLLNQVLVGLVQSLDLLIVVVIVINVDGGVVDVQSHRCFAMFSR